jgi:hypothetical protein
MSYMQLLPSLDVARVYINIVQHDFTIHPCSGITLPLHTEHSHDNIFLKEHVRHQHAMDDKTSP